MTDEHAPPGGQNADWVTTTTILDRLVRSNDQDVWERFVSRFRRPLANFARRLGAGDDQIDDLTQEILIAFMNSYREGKYKRESGRLRSWLFGIAYRQIANHRRRWQREHEQRHEHGGYGSFWEEVPEEPQAQDAWDTEWERAALACGLDQVRGEFTENTYRAFELVVRGGQTPDAAATAIGISRDAVYVAKHRVLKRLGEVIREFESE